jgi:K+-transporting ATPase ATPase C chain
MIGQLRTAVLMVVVLTALVGIAYPLAVTGVAQVAFHQQANGSLLRDAGGRVIGSTLIGQEFTSSRYFHPRPSAAGSGYDATSSGGTNLGPTSAVLLSNTVHLAAAIRRENGLAADAVLPSDAAAASASGLDPDISPAYADLQVARVAKVRGLTQAQVRTLVQQYTSGRDLGVLGDPRVNVLELNLALDRLKK